MNTNFGKILKEYREQNKCSQTELATLLGISRNYVSLIERGVRDNISWRLGCRILAVCVPAAERKCPECKSLNAMITDDFSQGVCNHCGFAWIGGYPSQKLLDRAVRPVFDLSKPQAYRGPKRLA